MCSLSSVSRLSAVCHQGPFYGFCGYPISKPYSFSSHITYSSYSPSGFTTILSQGPFCEFCNLTGQTIPSISRFLENLNILNESSHLLLVINSPIIMILQHHTPFASYQALLPPFFLPCHVPAFSPNQSIKLRNYPRIYNFTFQFASFHISYSNLSSIGCTYHPSIRRTYHPFSPTAAMSTSTDSTSPKPLQPLSHQRNTGGDMCMSFFARTRHPRSFTPFSPLQMIKSFNVETVAGVLFPPPEWLTDSMYAMLQAPNGLSYWAYFSLNIAMYPPTLVSSDWDNKWFFMFARVHPYALIWEIEPTDRSDPLSSDGPQNYTIPVLMIRDQYYQP